MNQGTLVCDGCGKVYDNIRIHIVKGEFKQFCGMCQIARNTRTEIVEERGELKMKKTASKKKSKISDETIAKIKKLKKDGLSFYAIGKQLKMYYATVKSAYER